MRAMFLLLVVAGSIGCRGREAPTNELILSCIASEQCNTGSLCIAGGCTIASCNPLLELACDTEGLQSPECCRPSELCSGLSFTCEENPVDPDEVCDPADATCTQCEEPADCDSGQFCSSGLCVTAVGRNECTSSFQCPTGERCDPSVYVCAPRRECLLCGPDFPHLCCDEEEVCSQESGFCTFPPWIECGDEGDCSPGLFCDALNRCVQCDDKRPCGPGLSCNEAVGECISNSACVIDDDCDGDELCARATLVCVVPQCLSDGECVTDPRLTCNVATFTCELPAPVCTNDLDEENDSPSNATSLGAPVGSQVAFEGALCRGDTDVVSFSVVGDKRYTATLDFGMGTPGILVSMLDGDLNLKSTVAFGSGQSSIEIAGVTEPAESGTFFLSVDGNSDAFDERAYSITILESGASR